MNINNFFKDNSQQKNWFLISSTNEEVFENQNYGRNQKKKKRNFCPGLQCWIKVKKIK